MYCPKCGTRAEGRFCPNCGTELPQGTSATVINGSPVSESASTVKSTKLKKPLYKRIWFWILIVILVGFLFGLATSDQPTKSSESEELSSIGELGKVKTASEVAPMETEEETAEESPVPVQEEKNEPTPAPVANTETPTPEKEPIQEYTMAQRNAIGTAEDYLDYTAFSESGLIEQLVFEGYSTEDATFAVQHITVNWSEQATKCAEQYLNYTAFSESGLIEQLVHEGYSTEDANFAIQHITVNWNEQAAKCAENYLEYTSFSRQDLVEQLMFEGFTQEQAEYGVSAVGY